MSSFQNLDLLEELKKYLAAQDFSAPTDVQAKAIPKLLDKKNLSVLAQTGTGKTLAYALSIFSKIKENDEDIPMESQIGAPRAIVVVPTRELITQVKNVFKGISHFCKLRVRSLEGGKDKGKGARTKQEAYDILVIAPGRLLSSLKRGEVKTDLLEYLIIDEADQLLDMGFSKDLLEVNKVIEKNNPTVALFTATQPVGYPEFVSKVFREKSFETITLQGTHGIKKSIETFNIYLSQKQKNEMLGTFLDKEAKGSGVIFLNRKEEIEAVKDLISQKFPRRKVWMLHGNMDKNQRKENFKGFVEKGGYLVASDVAARGIDIKEVNWVLNYDLPFEAVYYIHRCGRTGRGKRSGVVYNFVTNADVNIISKINIAIKGQSSLALKTINSPKNNSKAGPVKKAMAKPVKKKQGTKSSKKKTAKKVVRQKRGPRYAKK